MFKSKIILLIAFVSGMAVTAMEISASRLLAPYFGTSLFVWTNIIGVVLLALATGYYLGGKLSEKNPHLDFLYKIILSAGFLCMLAPLLIRPLAMTVIDTHTFSLPVFIVLGSLSFSAILFGVPLVLLGMTSPFLIKIATLHQEKVGDISGKIFALSTIGSIVGTFLPTFFLIPFVGTRTTITIFAGILMVLGGLGLKKKWLFISFAVLIVIFLSPQGMFKPGTNVLAESESLYQFIQITEKNNIRYLSIDMGLGMQSIYNPLKTTTGNFYDPFMILPYLVTENDPTRVLIVGLAGGTIARGLNAEFGTHITMEGVEIDSIVTDLSKKYFDLGSIPINIHETDGRVFLQSGTKKYNIIVIDAFQNEFHIPWTMTTKEFWQIVEKHLTKDGLVAINVIAPTEESPLLNIITNTMASALPYAIIAHPGKDTTFNFFVIGSKNKLDLALLEKTRNPDLAEIGKQVIDSAHPFVFDPQKRILTDDNAPVEFLTDTAFLSYFQ